jgi:hypothetical protein
MTQKTTTPEPKTSSTWERLEDFVRERVQQFVQALLEEEVTELLGRTKSARRETVDAAPGEVLSNSVEMKQAVMLLDDECLFRLTLPTTLSPLASPWCPILR